MRKNRKKKRKEMGKKGKKEKKWEKRGKKEKMGKKRKNGGKKKAENEDCDALQAVMGTDGSGRAADGIGSSSVPPDIPTLGGEGGGRH